jgi:hypothetical protein
VREVEPEGATLRPLALAGAASLGAGAIHAAAIGVHSEHRQAVYAFTAAAVFQLGWGAVALVRSSRRLALVGAVGNAAIVGGWVLAKTTGIAFVEGLTEAEAVQTADGLAAGLALVAVLIAASVVVSPEVRSARLAVHGGVVALAVAAFTVPAMVAAGSHTHTGGHADDGSNAAADDAGHAHDDEHVDEHAVGDAEGDTASTEPGVVHDHGSAVPVTSAELEAAARLVADTTIGVEPFEDLEAAEAAGYRQVAPPRNGLVHYTNTSYTTDGRILDPERPESLIYLDLTDGTWMLVGAMYRMPAVGQPGPRVGGPLTAWHAHDNLCRADGRVVAVAVDGACPMGELSDTPEMLHVWLVENPDGVFSDDMEPTGLLDIVQG